MMDSERDALLARLDERTANTWRAVETIQKHQETQNGCLERTIKECANNTTWVKALKWVGASIVAVVFGWLSWLTKILLNS